MDKPQSASVATLKAIVDAFNAHDLDDIMEFFADDCSLDMPRGPEPWGKRFTGKAAVREGLAMRFKGLPDVHYGDDPTPLSGESMEKALHELPLEDSVIDCFKQISGSGPLPRS